MSGGQFLGKAAMPVSMGYDSRLMDVVLEAWLFMNALKAKHEQQRSSFLLQLGAEDVGYCAKVRAPNLRKAPRLKRCGSRQISGLRQSKDVFSFFWGRWSGWEGQLCASFVVNLKHR